MESVNADLKRPRLFPGHAALAYVFLARLWRNLRCCWVQFVYDVLVRLDQDNGMVRALFAAAPKLQSDMKLEATRTLKAGAGLVQQFTVSGVPAPSVTWSLNGQPLDATAISSTAELTSLSVKKSSVKDAGQYEVTATNEVGTDTVRFTVVVNGL